MGSDECCGQCEPLETPYLVLNSDGKQIGKEAYLHHAIFKIRGHIKKMRESGEYKPNEEFVILNTETLEVHTYRNNLAVAALHNNESKAHAHANLIIMWALGGVDVQSRYQYEKDGKRIFSEWEDDKFPLLNKNFEYRIKSS